MKHCPAIHDTFKVLTPITVNYGVTKDVQLFTILIEIKKFLMESLFKNVIGLTIVLLTPNGKLTFPVLDKIHLFLFLTISNDLDLTALFKYPKSGHK